MELKKIFNRNNKYYSTIYYFTITLTFFLFYFSPFLVKGADVFIDSHDNLDSINMLGIFDGDFKGNFFFSDEVDQFTLPGIDRRYKLRNITFEKLLFYLFGYFGGYFLNEVIIRIIAFCGMLCLIKILKKDYKFPILFQILAALSFASLPFYPNGILSIAGLPMLCVSYINLFNKNHKTKSYIYIIFFGFYSQFVFVGFFIGIIIIITFLFLLLIKKLNKWFFIGSLLLLASYLLSHYNLFINQIFYDFETNRSMVSGLNNAKNISAIEQFFKIIYSNQYHAVTNHSLIVLPCVFVLLFENFHLSKMKNLILIFITFIISSAVLVGLSYFLPFVNIIGSSGGFQWNRFYTLNPFIWYALWTLLLIEMYNFNNVNLKFFYTIILISFFYGKSLYPYTLLLFIIIVLSLLFLFAQKLFTAKKKNSLVILSLLFSQLLLNTYSYTYASFFKKPSFNDFFSSEQFQKIILNSNINKSTSRIGCIGFFPSVANYNGLKTLGAYENIYPAEYKKIFYEVIKGEISKNEFLNNYFTNGPGSRLYLYDNDIGKPYFEQWRIKSYYPEIICDLDIQKMQQLGTTHIFSTVKIKNYLDKSLQLLYISDEPEYYYNMFVYKIKNRNK